MKTNFPKWLRSAGQLLRQRATPSAAGNSFGSCYPKLGRDSTIQIGGIIQALAEIIFRGLASLFCLGKAAFQARENLIPALG